jgi:hypothetical protein
MNMTLLAPEDLSVLPQYYNMLKSIATHSICAFILDKQVSSFSDTIQSSVWTSGSSEGESCDVQRRFAWCPSGKMINESQIADVRFWKKPPDGSASTQRCLELTYDAAAGAKLASANCSTDKKPFICQVCNFYASKIK